MSEASISFFNRLGHRLAGVLRLPDEQGPAPAVLMCQGFSGVKHLVLSEIAAGERRARAVVSVSGPGDGASMLRALRPSWDWISLQRSLEADRSQVATTGRATEVTLEEITPFGPALTVAYDQVLAGDRPGSIG